MIFVCQRQKDENPRLWAGGHEQLEYTYIMKAHFRQYGPKECYTIYIRNSEAGTGYIGLVILGWYMGSTWQARLSAGFMIP